MACLFALLGAFAPRIAFLVLWLFTPLVNAAFDTFIFPLLGLIFLPFTTLLYVLVIGPAGSTDFWGWLIILMGLLIDLRSYGDAYTNKDQIQNMPGMTSSTTT